MNSKALLEEILADIAACLEKGQNPQVIFDLDGTLFDNGPRTWNLVAECLETEGLNVEREKLNQASQYRLPYLVTDLLSSVGIDNSDVVEKVNKYWFDRFFTDEWQARDEALEGAREFVDAVYASGATVVYLTGRDVPGMLAGCAASLRACGFPVGLTRTILLMKPDFETPDLDYKREATKFLHVTGTTVAAFDNEPGNCNLFAETWPEGRSVFVKTTWAPNPPPLRDDVLTVDGFA